MVFKVLNPTSEMESDEFALAPRLSSLAGKTVGFISNGKEGTKGFFAHLERLLKEQLQVGEVIYLTKSNYSAPAEEEIAAQAAGWDLAVTGLGD